MQHDRRHGLICIGSLQSHGCVYIVHEGFILHLKLSSHDNNDVDTLESSSGHRVSISRLHREDYTYVYVWMCLCT